MGWRWLDRQWLIHASELACLFAALALIFGLLTVILRIELDDKHLSMQWGTVPDWLAALGGLATVAALIVAWALYRHEVYVRREDQHAHRDEVERQQANAITAWVESGQPGKADIGLINASHGVVYDLRMTVRTESASGDIGSEILHSAIWNGGSEARVYASVMPPGTWICSVKLKNNKVIARNVDVAFRDQRNIWWRRNGLGILVKWTGPPFAVHKPGSIGNSLEEALSQALRVTQPVKVHLSRYDR